MRRARMLRGAAAAFFSVLVGLVFHAGAGGAASLVASAFAFLGAAWIGVVLSTLKLRTAAVFAVVAVGQWLLHVFMTFASAAAAPAAGSGSLLETSAHALCMGLVSPELSPVIPAAVGYSGPLMLAAHAAAVIVSAAFVLFGERALEAVLAEILGPIVFVFLSAALPRTVRAAAPAADDVVRPDTSELLSSVSLRGPPVIR